MTHDDGGNVQVSMGDDEYGDDDDDDDDDDGDG